MANAPWARLMKFIRPMVTAVSPKAFEQALGMVRRGGTISLNGLPPGSFPLPIFDMVNAVQ